MNVPTETELHAYADGRLAPLRAAQVKAWLQENPDDALQVTAWQAQKALLRGAYRPFGQSPVPDRIEEMLFARRRRRWRLPPGPALWTFPRAAAVLCWITAGWIAGFVAHGHLRPAPADGIAMLPRQAAVAHVVYTPEVRHPVEVGAEQEAHLVQWLSKRLGGKLVIPDLQAAGFKLVGGRLLPAQQGPAAQFMYEDRDGKRLTLYVRTNAGHQATAFRFANEGGLAVFYWVDGPFGYAVSGSLERDAMLHIAGIAYPQLGGR
ncbi:MAG TPA: anti-sigma factor [Noviherbaspirillum sp.]|jgi:anti-sigma factor RsiW|uniref:anti-sigma factor family protein n=1 Tax=Noviherbaspirillum sp. TaxID=1926288 RepID=UPI002F93DFDF